MAFTGWPEQVFSVYDSLVHLLMGHSAVHLRSDPTIAPTHCTSLKTRSYHAPSGPGLAGALASGPITPCTCRFAAPYQFRSTSGGSRPILPDSPPRRFAGAASDGGITFEWDTTVEVPFYPCLSDPRALEDGLFKGLLEGLIGWRRLV